jgi:putative nucleotidyltransferase with HDIG domain
MGQNAQILIVDDEKGARKVIAEVLDSLGHQTTLAEDGRVAVCELEKSHFDIIFSDIKMPELDGIELLKYTRKNFPHILTVLVTAFADTETAIEAVTNKAYAYITKPFNIDEIELVTARAIEHIRLTSENERLLQDLSEKNEKLLEFQEQLQEQLQKTDMELVNSKKEIEEKIYALEKTHNSLKDSVEQLNAVQKLTEKVSKTHDLPQLLSLLIDLCRNIISFNGLAVFIENQLTGKLEIRFQSDLDQEIVDLLSMQVEEGIADFVMKERHPAVLPDIGALKDGQEKYFVILPLVSSGQNLGLVYLYTDNKRDQIMEEDLDLLNQLVSQSAVAIQNAIYLERMNQKIKQFSLLSDFAKQMGAILDIDLLFPHLLHEFCTELQSKIGYIMLKKDNHLYGKAALGLEELVIKNLKLEIGDGVAGWVAEQKQGLLIDNLTNDPRWLKSPIKHLGFNNILSVPLVFKGDIIGVIALANKKDDQEFTYEDLEYLQALADHAAITIVNAQMYKDSEETFFQTIRVLAEAINSVDPFYKGHSNRVCRLSETIARDLGVDEDEIKTVRRGALLHDIGKVEICDSIIQKPAPLDDNEFAIMKEHPVIGDRIIKDIPYLKKERLIVRHHHERVDGKGYPDGIPITDLPVSVGIVAVVDAFFAMTAKRPYREAMSEQETIEILRKNKGSQYIPEVVDSLVKSLHPAPEKDKNKTGQKALTG